MLLCPVEELGDAEPEVEQLAYGHEPVAMSVHQQYESGEAVPWLMLVRSLRRPCDGSSCVPNSSVGHGDALATPTVYTLKGSNSTERVGEMIQQRDGGGINSEAQQGRMESRQLQQQQQQQKQQKQQKQ